MAVGAKCTAMKQDSLAGMMSCAGWQVMGNGEGGGDPLGLMLKLTVACTYSPHMCLLDLRCVLPCVS